MPKRTINKPWIASIPLQPSRDVACPIRNYHHHLYHDPQTARIRPTCYRHGSSNEPLNDPKVCDPSKTCSKLWPWKMMWRPTLVISRQRHHAIMLIKLAASVLLLVNENVAFASKCIELVTRSFGPRRATAITFFTRPALENGSKSTTPVRFVAASLSIVKL